jgi:sigma-B regulation protein RsbU (phosphoserine phosphatase)
MAIGVVEDADWQHGSVQLEPGAALLLYTDGVLDTHDQDGQRFDHVGLLDFLSQMIDARAHDLHDGLLARLQAFRGAEPQFDDITLVVVRREP